MTYDPNYTRTTPVHADRWNCTCEQPEGHLVCPTHGKWPNRYTPDRTYELVDDSMPPVVTLPPDHPEGAPPIPSPPDPRVGELGETCRVLTELAQHLTNALTTPHDHNRVIAAIEAAAELGITPQES